MKGKTRKELKIYRIRCIKLFILGLLVCMFSAFAFEYAIYCVILSNVRMDYVVKCGLVVPSEENATYYESLKGQDKINYKYTEWMCFKQNNQAKITIVKDRAVPKAKYKENTFVDNGEGNFGTIMWVSRTPDEQRVDFTGKTYYAHVSKTFPEYSEKCGGTDMAFFQWGNYPMAYTYDYCYNKIVEGVFDKESQFKNLMDCEWWN